MENLFFLIKIASSLAKTAFSLEKIYFRLKLWFVEKSLVFFEHYHQYLHTKRVLATVSGLLLEVQIQACA